MNKELRFSFTASTFEPTATLLNDESGEELVTLNKKQALWLAERILKNFDFKLE